MELTQTSELNQPHLDKIKIARLMIETAEQNLRAAITEAYAVGARLVRAEGKRRSYFTVMAHGAWDGDYMQLRNDVTGALYWDKVSSRKYSLRTFVYKEVPQKAA